MQLARERKRVSNRIYSRRMKWIKHKSSDSLQIHKCTVLATSKTRLCKLKHAIHFGSQLTSIIYLSLKIIRCYYHDWLCTAWFNVGHIYPLIRIKTWHSTSSARSHGTTVRCSALIAQEMNDNTRDVICTSSLVRLLQQPLCCLLWVRDRLDHFNSFLRRKDEASDGDGSSKTPSFVFIFTSK